jgi:hypothetical protein
MKANKPESRMHASSSQFLQDGKNSKDGLREEAIDKRGRERLSKKNSSDDLYSFGSV